jgi:CelD/BcsL family acetyltransferase involved in cellulose biosynthesis
MQGKVTHQNALGGSIDEFLCDAAVQLAREGLAVVHLAEHAGIPVAAQLVLSDGSTDYISASGLNPQFWDLNLNTMLIFRAVQGAVANGRRSVNLSTGPNVAKMRWSSKVVTHNDFDIVPGARGSRLFHEFFTHAALALDHRQERRRHRVLDFKGRENCREHPVAGTLAS